MDQQGKSVRPTDTQGANTDIPTPPPTEAFHPEGVRGAVGEPFAGTRLPGFGDYELLAEIARGGMGVVYKARQVSLNRIVALKMILAGQLAGEEDVKRFHAEAEAAAHLDHPGIVPIFEVGCHEGQHYFSMGYVEGQSLAELLRDGPLAPRQAAELVRQVAEAVQYAHDHGVIHRDLKPANVLLQKAEGGRRKDEGQSSAKSSSSFIPHPSSLQPPSSFQPRISDFGLAKRVAGDSELTATGQVLGTPGYMPPEQAAGKLDQVGPSSDVYALGGVLYAALTGRAPFHAASSLDTLLQVLKEEPVSPRQLNPAVDRDLETITMKCLEKQPRRRYRAAGELADELQRYLEGQAILGRPISQTERVLKWVRRRPTLAAFIAASVVAALALVGVVVAAAYNHRLVQARRTEAHLRVVAQEALNKADTYLYFNRIALAERNWWSNNVLRTRKLLDECPRSRRRWEWFYLDHLFHSELLLLKESSGGVRSAAFSPDGKLIASGDEHGDVRIWNAATGRQIATLPGHTFASAVATVAFSPDGCWLASVDGVPSHGGEAILWNASQIDSDHGASAKPAQHVLSIRPGEHCDLAFSPKGDVLAVASGHRSEGTGMVQLFALPDGRKIRSLDTKHNAVYAVAFSPDGQRLAVGGAMGALSLSNSVGAGFVQVWDVDPAQPAASLLHEQDLANVSDVAFSPDGRFLAAAGAEKVVQLWDATTYQKVRTLRGHDALVTKIAFGPDSTRVVSASSDSTVRIWNVETGEELETLRGHTADVNSVAYDAGGRRIVSAGSDGTVRIWDATKGQFAQSLKGHAKSVQSVAFAPDGRFLVSGSLDQTVRLWDLSAGGTGQILGKDQKPVWCVAVSPDGSRIAAAEGDWQDTSHAGQVGVWDALSGEELWRQPAHPGIVWSVAFSPDGARLASAGGELAQGPGGVKVWDVSTAGQLLAIAAPQGILRVAYSPDGQRLAGTMPTASTGQIRIWDARSGREIRRLSRQGVRPLCIAFSPDAKWIASGGTDQTVKLWNAETGTLTRTFGGHTSDVLAVAFSPDGTRLVSAGFDHTVRFWDLEYGQEVLTLRGHSEPVFSVVFSPDGHRVASAGDDTSIRLWDAFRAGEGSGRVAGLQGSEPPVARTARELAGRDSGHLRARTPQAGSY